MDASEKKNMIDKDAVQQKIQAQLDDVKAQAEQLKAAPHLEVKSGETMRIVFLNLNTLADGPLPALRDIRVRQAIQHAIDRRF